MLVNPNNHALDGGPGASGLEVEVVDQLRVMFGLPAPGLGHLTSSGTIANLEALWVAREVHPGKRIVHSSAAHYTHARMCELLGITGTAVAPDAYGRLDLDAVEAECAKRRRRDRRAHDRVDRPGRHRSRRRGARPARALRRAPARRRRLRRLLHAAGPRRGPARRPRARTRRSRSATRSSSIPTSTACSPTAAARSSSPTRRSQRVYRHDSPFTYFTEAELHLGEISLECSRAGAAAAGAVADAAGAAARARRGPRRGPRGRAARRARLGARGCATSDVLALHVEPELDIVTYLPRGRLAVGARRRQRRRAQRRHGGSRRPGLPQHAATSGATRSSRATPSSSPTPTARACCAACS